MELVIASNNQNKIKEIKAILGKYFSNITTLNDKNIHQEIPETGTTFLENALIKARTVNSLTGCAALGDDSGLVVHALDGAPGVYSARYAGLECNTEKNNTLLLHNLKDKTNRTAYFETCLALILPDGTEFHTSGTAEGHILTEPKGTNGFGYDPLFFSDVLNKSFAEASLEEKNKVSHRASALMKMLPILEKYFGK